jgi:hypothetical protein
MQATANPRITAATIAEAATRLLGTVVQFVEDHTIGPAVYRSRLEAFETIDGAELGPDDGTIINLLPPGVTARDLIEQYGTPGKAAAALNRQLRDEDRAVNL